MAWIFRDRRKRDTYWLDFGGTTFVHRWSQQGTHEFTPQDDANLAAWSDMLTINVHDQVRDSDGLDRLADALIRNYETHGHLMAVLPENDAIHFVAAALAGPHTFELAFSRLDLFEGRGVVVVYGKCFRGPDALKHMQPWLDANASTMEKNLLEWDGMPPLAELRALESR
ncbi:hypothetical protein NDR87_25580 [Nocardia sp. CDC159]|uniref:Uncharacterized protein n=1 Tax=Nocardia pulmonis TaxID=2951408 RepID=A0A9X2E705_9NOCA|nr:MULTISPECIES: hypothetical protein [Nocardia]MCM6774816.1 hypothetical protein [Nocardia pulmonis]MCM6789747.1 hypothetical protein [Nocardia sp. CDC159]